MFGLIGLVFAVAVSVFGLLQLLKGKRILAAPFAKTGDIAANPKVADAKGMVSTEGKVIAPRPLNAPISGQACLYYEVEIKRDWEKTEEGEKGPETKKGTSHVDTIKKGMVFQLNDGSGHLRVDLSEGADYDLKKVGDKAIEVGDYLPGSLQFGTLEIDTPSVPEEEITTSFKAVEKIIPVEPQFFVLGKLDAGVVKKPNWRSLMLSKLGRDGLLASTEKKSKLGFVGGGAIAVLSIPLFFLGPEVGELRSSPCDEQLDAASCSDKVTEAEGHRYLWTVSKAGRYTVEVAPPSDAIWAPQVEVEDLSGKVLAAAEEVGPGSPASVSGRFQPGHYKIRVADQAAAPVKKGYGFKLSIAAAEDATVAKDEQ